MEKKKRGACIENRRETKHFQTILNYITFFLIKKMGTNIKICGSYFMFMYMFLFHFF